MRTYIVKTAQGYLYSREGMVSYTDDETHAGHFLSQEEAHVIARVFGYAEGRYQVISVDVPDGVIGYA